MTHRTWVYGSSKRTSNKIYYTVQSLYMSLMYLVYNSMSFDLIISYRNTPRTQEIFHMVAFCGGPPKTSSFVES